MPPKSGKKTKRSAVVAVDPSSGALFAVSSGAILKHCTQPPIDDSPYYKNGFDCDVCGKAFDPQPFFHSEECDCCLVCAKAEREAAEDSHKTISQRVASEIARDARNQSVASSSEQSTYRVRSFLTPSLGDLQADETLLFSARIERDSVCIVSLVLEDGGKTTLTNHVVEEGSRRRGWIVRCPSLVSTKHLTALYGNKVPKKLQDAVGDDPVVDVVPKGADGILKKHPLWPSLVASGASASTPSAPRSRSNKATGDNWTSLPRTVLEPPALGSLPVCIQSCSFHLFRRMAADEVIEDESDIATNPSFSCFFLTNGSVQVVNFAERKEVLFHSNKPMEVISGGSLKPEEEKVLKSYAKEVLEQLLSVAV